MDCNINNYTDYFGTFDPFHDSNMQDHEVAATSLGCQLYRFPSDMTVPVELQAVPQVNRIPYAPEALQPSNVGMISETPTSMPQPLANIPHQSTQPTTPEGQYNDSPIKRARDNDSASSPAAIAKRVKVNDENINPTDKSINGTAKVNSEKKPRKTSIRSAKANTAKVKEEQTKSALSEIKSREWSDGDTLKLLEAILGTEPVTDFMKFQKNPLRYYKKIAKLIFQGSRTSESIKGRYERLRKTFTCILAFESYTGGGGDPDMESEDGDQTLKQLEKRIAAAKQAGKQVGPLSAKVYQKWQDCGWYDLFASRLSEHPNIVREHDFHSGIVSDWGRDEDDERSTERSSDADDGDGDSEVAASASLPGTVSAPKTPAKATKTSMPIPSAKTPSRSPSFQDEMKALAKKPGVPEPKHPGHKRKSLELGSVKTEDFFEANAAFLKSTQKTNEGQLDLMKRKLEADEIRYQWQRDLEKRRVEAEEKHQEHLRMEARVKNARDILADPNISAEVKAVAQGVLTKYLMGELA